MRRLLLLACLLLPVATSQAAGRYLTWVDEQGRVHNSFVGQGFVLHRQQAEQRIRQSDQQRLSQGQGAAWPRQDSASESKRRYFTWVDANGNLQNSFHAGSQMPTDPRDGVLASGEQLGDYISSDVLEGRAFERGEGDGRYYTWVDDQGRTRNSYLPQARQAAPPAVAGAGRYSEGREVVFSRRPIALPGLDGQPTPAMQALLAGSRSREEGPYQELLQRCCGQLAEQSFTKLSREQPRYEELNRFSPRLDFPMGSSYYAALRLPASGQEYGLRIRSFANKQLVYPSLLFLDERKQPTRLVSDAVYQLHPETWHRYAFIEGTLKVKPGERYVLLLTTEDDRNRQTLDNKPFKRPLQAVEVNQSGMQAHAHVEEGSFELAIVR
jgi:hypothetical protein